MERLSEILARVAQYNEKNRPAVKARRVSPWILAALLIGTVDVVGWYVWLRSGVIWPALGMDLGTYLDAARSFLGGTGYFHAYQFAPYQVWTQAQDPILYPPVALWLFVPFTVLPSVLWWAVPAGIIAWSLPRNRRLLLALALLAWPQTAALVLAGNPVMWCAAFVALARKYPVFGPFALLKPTIGPFALRGITHRGWWLGLAILAIMAIPFGTLWLDYITVVLNADNGQGYWYIVGNVPIMLAALIGTDQIPLGMVSALFQIRR